jgi:hypothetical protein
MHTRSFRYFAPWLAFLIAGPLSAQSIEYLPGIEWPEPPVVTPGNANCPPSDAVVLFNGKDLSAWEGSENWQVKNCVAIAGKGNIRTKESFGDCQLHIEWSAPKPAKGKGQDRGNSGVFFMDVYEIQVLDSYEADTYRDGQAGAIYKQMPPMVNAMRPPGEWNVYDIVWNAPRFKEDGSLESPAHITAFHNGVLIQNHLEIKGGTFWHSPPSYSKHDAKMPISLQDHGHPVRYRNIWVREFAPIVGKQVKTPSYIDHATKKTWNEGEEPPKSEDAAE